MQKILRRRVLRDLKKNWFRYVALGVLIVFCMFIIIGMMGAAETIIQGVEKYCEEYHLEDGEFRVFVPLTGKEKTELEDLGVELEKQFYMDFKLEDNSTLRVMKNRETINRVKIEEGDYAQTSQEVVLEKRYCEEKDIQVGDKITIAEKEYEIVGIGCTPDYDSPLKEFGDSTIDSEQFGLAFFTENAYKELRKSKKSIKAQEYVYAYRLKGDTE